METETSRTLDSLQVEDADSPAWRITGLKPQHQYVVSIMALSDDANRTSAESQSITVTTYPEGQSDGISLAQQAPVLRREYYDVHGRRVSTSSKGIVVCRVYHSDGSISTEKRINY